MQGEVYNIKPDKYGKLFGNIRGNNKESYYFRFDPQYFVNEEDTEILKVGDIVSFEPFIKYKERGPWARDIQIIDHKSSQSSPQPLPQRRNISLSYYEPGYSKAIPRGSLSTYLKPHSGEIDILDKLSGLIRIQHINTHDLGHGDMFPFCILGATELLRQYMGAYEFILVFSHFDSKMWQNNSLQAINSIRKRKEVAMRRPLVNFYLMISNALNFKQEIDRIKGGTDSAIIPFSFEEIMSCTSKDSLAELILSRFDEYYYENDMLGENRAIEDDALLFGDRGKIADAITQRCSQKRNSGIFGLRRSGKTSVLYAVFRRLEAQSIKYAPIKSRALSAFPSYQRALYEVAKRVKIAAFDLVQGEYESRSEFEKRLNLNSTIDDYMDDPINCFHDDIRLYTGRLPYFVIAFDEIECITYNTSTSTVWKKLETYENFFEALRDCGCSLIFCGVNATINEKSIIYYNNQSCDNPMHERIEIQNGFSKTYLPAFTDEQTKYMINTLGSYSNIQFDYVFSNINQAFGGQPYFIRQFCSFVYSRVKDQRTKNQPLQITKATYDALLREFYKGKGQELCETILEYVSTLYVEEYEMLKKLALSPDRYCQPTLEQARCLDHLEKYGLIERDFVTGFVTFRIELIQLFLQQTATKRPEDMNNEERRRYVQDCVANCERKLKKYIVQYYKMHSRENDAKRWLKSHGIKTNKNAIPTPDFNLCTIDEVFDHSKFIIYFSTLSGFITDNWGALGQKLDAFNISKERFKVCMSDLNAGRNDADHYDPEDMEPPPDGIWEIDDKTLKSFMVANDTFADFFNYIL